jgi:predicted nuclease with TOPRIM domain
MSTSFDPNGILKPRDQQGNTVGVVLANQDFQNLTAENERLRAEMTRLQTDVAEREQKIHSLYALLEEVAGFTPDQLTDHEKNGASLDEVIAELENLNSLRLTKAPL